MHRVNSNLFQITRSRHFKDDFSKEGTGLFLQTLHGHFAIHRINIDADAIAIRFDGG